MAVEKVIFERQVIDSMMTYFGMAYPNEGILVMRGKKKNGIVRVTGLVIPPAAVHAHTYSSFSWHLIPVDPSYVGVAHSHPSGHAYPSEQDVFSGGKIMAIMGYPYSGENCLGVFDGSGTRVPFEVINPS